LDKPCDYRNTYHWHNSGLEINTRDFWANNFGELMGFPKAFQGDLM
jgi:hypothetical protein